MALQGEEIPPVLDDLDDELRDFLLKPELLSIHAWEKSQIHWPREPDVQSLFSYKEIPFQSSIKPVRNHLNEIVGWKEEINPHKIGREDVSMKRPPLPASLATQGVATQLPFLPAGFEDEQAQMKIFQKPKTVENLESSEPGTFLGEKLLFIAPSFTSGLIFAPDGYTLFGDSTIENENDVAAEPSKNETLEDGVDEIQTVVEKENHLIGLWTDPDNDTAEPSDTKTESSVVTNIDSQNESLFDECFVKPLDKMPDLPVLKISDQKLSLKAHETEWAEILDVTKPVEDFRQRIPNMAHNYPFELDTFQKQAILKLEEQGHVFVSAHTSAGKTVVAEYAIALSKNHCTRTVYTSPIKALSNQKYQDFSRTFGDVGLMTGDLQINTTASCLVMTTEILRSMLYHGSDVVRDLEYVIFDEVHYINNVERGYVWEEILILLPPHVSIVMLSATVPNSLEFADWVGRTKKRKVYVVSTQKRPVPLCHYLYTGSSGSSKNNLFPIIDQDGNYLQKGFDLAVASKKATMSKFNQSFGQRGTRNHLNPNQEKTMWVAFIDHLRTNNKLPVVAFVLSRNRCDKIAEALQSIDLTTAREKAKIDFFIRSCLKRLKEPDRKLPQVMKMQALLACGVGIHHSGILPILKEIVEMLFQTGCVKILFATETFAMGVNMPARTVIFDSIMKFDGLQMRPLLPAEYIQMAGRAGRRGLDDTGSVIILCKKDVPDSMTLKAMMQGKPMKLSSQFRITYATMLSLLRATSVSVEGMMRRSFREFNVQSKANTYKKELEELEERVSHIEENPISPHLAALTEFYDVAYDYIKEMNDIMPVLLEQNANVKWLSPGRVFLIVCRKYINQLALYINFQGPRATPYKVLVLDRDDLVSHPPSVTENLETWYSLMGLAFGAAKVGSDVATLKHSVLCISAKNIIGLTMCTINTNIQLLLQDYEKRQQPRFRMDPPGPSCMQALQKMVELSYSIHSKQKQIDIVNLKTGLQINNGEILDSIRRCDVFKARLDVLRASTNIANFVEEIEKIFEQKQLLRKYNNLKKILSYEAMALYPEYQQRLKVLKELRYIDDQNCVAMKGRVACEMKTNELIITELVFRNVLTDLEPAKIAALLSCLVFQAHTNSEQVIDASLQESIKAIQAVDNDLSMVEKKYMVGASDPCLERLNFGLVQVVYDWAKGKPFAEIADLTDVHEGIIVRNIQQLHEVLTNVRDAAKIIGDPLLQSKMEEVSVSIKRDIVFCASLYTQGDIFSDM